MQFPLVLRLYANQANFKKMYKGHTNTKYSIHKSQALHSVLHALLCWVSISIRPCDICTPLQPTTNSRCAYGVFIEVLECSVFIGCLLLTSERWLRNSSWQGRVSPGGFVHMTKVWGKQLDVLFSLFSHIHQDGVTSLWIKSSYYSSRVLFSIKAEISVWSI